MLKRDIKFKDFEGRDKVKTAFFHYSAPELIDLEVKYPNGLRDQMQYVLSQGDPQAIVEFVKEFVLDAYGIRTEDGESFIKTPEAKEAFRQSLAYETLFMDLAFNGQLAAEFINGVIPQDMGERVDKILADQGMTTEDIMRQAREMEAQRTGQPVQMPTAGHGLVPERHVPQVPGAVGTPPPFPPPGPSFSGS